MSIGSSLWPDLSSLGPRPRGIPEMLEEWAGDISARTNGAIRLYVDTVGVANSIKNLRHNCYLHLPKSDYSHLLFRVTTPFPGPWPALAATPEGDCYPECHDEAELRNTVEQILQRERTKEVLRYLLSTVQ